MSGSSLPGRQASDCFGKQNPNIKLLAPDFFAASPSCPVGAHTGGWAGSGCTGLTTAHPCRRRWRQQGRSGDASCCPCATALGGAACWWLCCAVPTSPPWMPTATRTPLSACECRRVDRQVGSGGSPEPLSGATPKLTLSFPSSFLHPNVGKRSKYKTSVRKKTLNPEFNEVGQGQVGAVPATLGLGRSAFCVTQRAQVPPPYLSNSLPKPVSEPIKDSSPPPSCLSASFPAGVLLCRPKGGAGPEDAAGVCVGP